MAGQLKFHPKTGSLVTLSNDSKTATRCHPTQEFNNGVVLSSEPLKIDQLFEVRIDKKVNSWSGSIEIGVTPCDPSNLNFPISATGFREGTWVMSGSSVLKDGHSTIEEYGTDLDQLTEGDRVGVMIREYGLLHFFVNGIDQGACAIDVGPTVYGVVDLYGKCAQVSIVENAHPAEPLGASVAAANNVLVPNNSADKNTVANDVASQLASEFLTQLSNQIVNDLARSANNINLSVDEEAQPSSNRSDLLMFNEKCGGLVKLSNNKRTAERRRPLDEFNNGVVMTCRPLKDEEMFEIRLDKLVDKWSGSIEMGITTHNPSMLDFPATMTNMRSGLFNCTIMMSGCGILTNGKGTRREYGHYNLDELEQGDRIGLMRKSNGHLHYYINGQDQGIASMETPSCVWGVVDLYGMAVKVTILDRSDPGYPHSTVVEPPTRNPNVFRQYPDLYDEEVEDDEVTERLLFHPKCGSHAAVINSQKTAHRPNALDDFNNGVVLTARTLRPDELFEVRIDQMIEKWAGSIEIGVTLHSPHELDFPSTMTNIRSGTWMMTGNGVMHNGTTVIDEYGQNLDRLKAGDRVGVRRKADGTLHFYVNGIDQGLASTNVPELVYGVIDLYGQAAQATIVDHNETLSSPEGEVAHTSEDEELRFSDYHGRNAILVNGARTAERPSATGEFNDAIVMSNRALRDNEMFEVIIDKMVDRWSGSIEAGVTLINPDTLDFPNTMTDLVYDTWMLSGSAIMQDGSTLRNGYPLDLDTITSGSRIGIMRCSDETLHFFFNGVDQGVACSNVPAGVRAVIDLYGRCARVSIITTNTPATIPAPSNDNVLISELEQSLSSPMTDVRHKFSLCCGKNITVKNSGSVACRSGSYQNGLVFSSDPLRKDELFEIRIEQVSKVWSGSLHIGLTTMAISDSSPASSVPKSALTLTSKLTWIVSGSEVRKSGVVIKENYAPSLERLNAGDRVGVKRCPDGTMHILLNGEDLGVAASNIQKNVFAVIDLYGSVEIISVCSSSYNENMLVSSQLSHSVVSDIPDSLEPDKDQDQDTNTSISFEFHSNHGKNVILSNSCLTATRQESYNQGIVIASTPLPKNKLFQVVIEKLTSSWTSSLVIGVLGFPPDRYSLPLSAVAIKKSCIVIQGDAVFNCGSKVKEHYGPNLDRLQKNHSVGVLVDSDSSLHLYVNGVDQGVAIRDIPNPCYALVDLYGQCQQVSIIAQREGQPVVSSVVTEEREKADIDDVSKEKYQLDIENSIVRNCEIQNICSKIKSLMGLPDGYFIPGSTTCFCETCHKIRKDDLYLKRGDPPREYALPYGWCRFPIRLPPKSQALHIDEKWHLGFYGTRIEALRRILDSGDLHSVGETEADGSILLSPLLNFSEKSRTEASLKPIRLSPTIKYAGCNEFSPKQRMVEPKSKKAYHVRVAFQVYLKPGSYKVGQQSLGVNEQIDPKFTNNELEWSTKERGSIVLSALLLKIE